MTKFIQIFISFTSIFLTSFFSIFGTSHSKSFNKFLTFVSISPSNKRILSSDKPGFSLLITTSGVCYGTIYIKDEKGATVKDVPITIQRSHYFISANPSKKLKGKFSPKKIISGLISPSHLHLQVVSFLTLFLNSYIEASSLHSMQ